MDVSITIPKNTLRDNAVTTTKINNSAVTTAKIADGSVTQAKRAALPYATSANINNFIGSGGGVADVTNGTVTITTTGRPVVIKVIPTPGATGLGGYFTFGGTSNGTITAEVMRDATRIVLATTYSPGHASGFSAMNVDIFSTIDYTNTTPGTYVYKLRLGAPAAYWFQNFTLIAYEL